MSPSQDDILTSCGFERPHLDRYPGDRVVAMYDNVAWRVLDPIGVESRRNK